MRVKFGTSGLRGLAVDLLDGSADTFALAFVRHLLMTGYVQSGARMFVGRDLRESSPMIAARCVKALRRAGMVAVDCGVLPTPALALYSRANRAAAIMVTGSHIPADRNGLKFYRPDGEIDKADEASIAALAGKPAPWADTGSTTLPPPRTRSPPRGPSTVTAASTSYPRGRFQGYVSVFTNTVQSPGIS